MDTEKPPLTAWTPFVSPFCTCRWVPAELGGFDLTAARVNPTCVLHGPGKPFALDDDVITCDGSGESLPDLTDVFSEAPPLRDLSE